MNTKKEIRKAYSFCACSNNKTNVTKPKKIVLSKKPSCDLVQEKCKSAAKIDRKPLENARKLTKSELSVNTYTTSSSNPKDLFSQCGDNNAQEIFRRSSVNISLQPKPSTSSEKIKKTLSRATVPSKTCSSISKKSDSNKSEPIKQYYRNKNYKESESIRHLSKKVGSLDTIKESSEKQATLTSHSEEIIAHSSTSDLVTYIDADNPEVVKKIKNFRKENYFETHSARARLEQKAPLSDLAHHKCVYRFYLNERLFPVPVAYDRNNTIRCVECHLPMSCRKKMESDVFLNGTIQGKVRIGNEQLQDLTILLPVKPSLIVKEKRKEVRNSDDTLYFGVVKLSEIGGTLIDKDIEDDSLALRFQKGYKVHRVEEDYSLDGVNDNEVIYV